VANDVYRELQSLSQRYQKLRGVFVQFHKECAPILTSEGFLPGLTVGKFEEPAHFDVAFAGVKVRFAFSFDAVASRGKVACSRVDPWDPKKGEPVGEFTFNGQGDTGSKHEDVPYDGDPIYVNTDAGAALMAATYLRKALVPTKPTVSVSALRI
jgi:hypothetical protein